MFDESVSDFRVGSDSFYVDSLDPISIVRIRGVVPFLAIMWSFNF